MSHVAALGQIWWLGRIPARLLVLSDPHVDARGQFVFARRIGQRSTLQPPQRLEGKILTPMLDVHGALDGGRYVGAVPVLVCRDPMRARELSYLMRPNGLPDAVAVGDRLVPGGDVDPTVLAARAASTVLEEYAEPEPLARWREQVAALAAQ